MGELETALDVAVAAILPVLALWLLFSGIDDLLVDLGRLWMWLVQRRRPPPAGAAAPRPRIAIFVPLWREDAVIARMVEHNLAAIDYPDYAFFLGAYPNDQRTLAALRDLEARFRHVHIALCPHDGPTSKADCLNWIYQRMLLFEEEKGVRYDLVVTHDAEDLIHRDGLRSIGDLTAGYGMIQLPVLALQTPLRKLTHGVYCDEFAEYQFRDMPLRQFMGSFVPSCGVGTGFTREALERLAAAGHNCVFDPSCLTEDYENGVRLHRLGFRQAFVAARRSSPIATREYFPQTFRSAVRQRTRWVTGIALQGIERHGWRGSWRDRYWFWRDRKGLLGNPSSFLANLLFIYGCATWPIESLAASPLLERALVATLSLQIYRICVRIGFVSHIYGWRFAAAVPLRIIHANWINTVATVFALFRYARARWRGEPLLWLKTDHAYPSISALKLHKRPLGEILVGAGVIGREQLEAALAAQPAGVRLGRHLIALDLITERQLYRALGVQQSLPVTRVRPADVKRRIARALPAHVVRQWAVLPFHIADGSLYVAGPEIPSDEMQRDLRRFTSLTIRFHLVTPPEFEELKERLL